MHGAAVNQKKYARDGNEHLFELAKVLVLPEALQVGEGVDVVERVAVVGLRQAPGLALLLEEPADHIGDREAAVGADAGQQPVEEVLAERVRHLRWAIGERNRPVSLKLAFSLSGRLE